MIVLVTALVITHQSTLGLQISSTLAYYYTQDSHLDNISGIRTRAIEIALIYKIHLGRKNNIIYYVFF